MEAAKKFSELETLRDVKNKAFEVAIQHGASVGVTENEDSHLVTIIVPKVKDLNA